MLWKWCGARIADTGVNIRAVPQRRGIMSVEQGQLTWGICTQQQRSIVAGVNGRTVTTMTAIDVIGSLSLGCVVLILLVLKDIETELRTIRRDLKQKDGDHHDTV
jgi:hypothetical protein